MRPRPLAFVRSLCLLLSVLGALVCPTFALAQPSTPAAAAGAHGLAVVGLSGARDDAFVLARAVYASSLRPRALDELRARILAGDPAPPGSVKQTLELAELRASLTGADDAPSRRVLGSIAHDLGVAGLLLVSRAAAPAPDAAADDAGAPAAPSAVVVRLFVAESGELDAARYEPDPTRPDAPWGSTVRSLAARFPPPAPPPVDARARAASPARIPSDSKESKPFYASTWFWAALGGAALVGALIFFAAQDTSSDPIHLQMRIPR